MKKLNIAIKMAICDVALTTTSAFATDLDLLDTLLKNGVLNSQLRFKS